MVAGNAITRAGCWSHARRKFVEAEKTAPEIAREAVARIDDNNVSEREMKRVVAKTHYSWATLAAEELQRSWPA